MRIVDQSGKMSIPSEQYVIFVESERGEEHIVYAHNVHDKEELIPLALYDSIEKRDKLFEIILNDELAGAKVCNIGKKMI